MSPVLGGAGRQVSGRETSVRGSAFTGEAPAPCPLPPLSHKLWSQGPAWGHTCGSGRDAGDLGAGGGQWASWRGRVEEHTLHLESRSPEPNCFSRPVRNLRSLIQLVGFKEIDGPARGVKRSRGRKGPSSHHPSKRWLGLALCALITDADGGETGSGPCSPHGRPLLQGRCPKGRRGVLGAKVKPPWSGVTGGGGALCQAKPHPNK